MVIKQFLSRIYKEVVDTVRVNVERVNVEK